MDTTEARERLERLARELKEADHYDKLPAIIRSYASLVPDDVLYVGGLADVLDQAADQAFEAAEELSAAWGESFPFGMHPWDHVGTKLARAAASIHKGTKDVKSRLERLATSIERQAKGGAA